jgi:hypothetical protein
MQTGNGISPPGGYVGGGLQMQVDVGSGPAGDVWLPTTGRTIRLPLARLLNHFRPSAAARAWWSSLEWRSPCARRSSALPDNRSAPGRRVEGRDASTRSIPNTCRLHWCCVFVALIDKSHCDRGNSARSVDNGENSTGKYCPLHAGGMVLAGIAKPCKYISIDATWTE